MNKVRTILLSCILLSVTISTYASTNAGEVFKKASPAVYMVAGKDISGRVISQGSAVAIGINTVVTNCHVVSSAKSISLIQGKITIDAKKKSSDIERDLCILEISPKESIKTVAIRPSKSIEQGSEVYAIGAPLGLELTISQGVVSAKRDVMGGK